MALDIEQSSLEDEHDQIVDPLDYSGDEDDLQEDFDDEACVGVVRCVLSTTVDMIIRSILVFFAQSYRVEIRNVSY